MVNWEICNYHCFNVRYIGKLVFSPMLKHDLMSDEFFVGTCCRIPCRTPPPSERRNQHFKAVFGWPKNVNHVNFSQLPGKCSHRNLRRTRQIPGIGIFSYELSVLFIYFFFFLWLACFNPARNMALNLRNLGTRHWVSSLLRVSKRQGIADEHFHGLLTQLTAPIDMWRCPIPVMSRQGHRSPAESPGKICWEHPDVTPQNHMV